MIVVLDSNVIVAAFAGRGLCSSVFELCINKYTICISEHILTEVKKALTKKIKLPATKAAAINEYLQEFCQVNTYAPLCSPICRDSDDDNILALSVQSNADYIITGDTDLLEVKSFGEIPIISPRRFWEIAKQSC